MMTVAHLSGIYKGEVGDSAFRALVEIYPEGNFRPQGHTFRCSLPQSDLRVGRITAVLDQAGFRPWIARDGTEQLPRRYTLQLQFRYEPADYADAPLLRLYPPEGACTLAGTERGGKNALIIRESMLPESAHDFLLSNFYSYFVPTRVRDVLRASELLGLTMSRTWFSPQDATVEDTDQTIQDRHGTPYWEVDSTLQMPAFSPLMQLFDRIGKRRLPRGSPEPVLPRDDLYINPEFHYLASDIAALPAFDIARTYETFLGYGAPGDRPLIVSNRFYRFCRDNGLITGWAPVRIDP